MKKEVPRKRDPVIGDVQHPLIRIDLKIHQSPPSIDLIFPFANCPIEKTAQNSVRSFCRKETETPEVAQTKVSSLKLEVTYQYSPNGESVKR